MITNIYTATVKTTNVLDLPKLQKTHAGNIIKTEIRVTASLNPEYILHLRHPIPKSPAQLLSEAF